MERLRSHHQQQQQSLGGSAQQLSNKQKWSFGRLFRKKKEEEAEGSASSSEEDRKAGFVPSQRQSASKPKSKHAGKSARGSNKSLGFDHIVMPTAAAPQPPPHPAQPQHIDNEFFLPVEMVPPEPYYQNQPGYYNRSSNSLDRRLYLNQQLAPAPHKSRSAQRGKQQLQPGVHSSEEELISLNSSTFSKYRSDESIHSGGQALHGVAPGQSRRSRAARNERYYKRLSRDGEVSHGGVPPQFQQQQQQQQPLQTQRYKTQPLPLSIYQAPPQSNSNSNSGYVQWQPQAATRPLQNSMQSDGKRSISYDSHIHLQNVNGRMQSKPLPPPPPPRDPLRRVHVMGSSSGDLRPVSYAFDQGGRCVSDDRIWQPPHYQSVHSLNSQPSSSIVSAPSQQQSQQQSHPHRRFITRNERNALPGKKSLPNGIDFHYVADATPRSRKPIHMLEASSGSLQEPPSSGVLRTSKSGLPTDNWQQQQQQSAQRAAPALTKPRSISSSRLSELRSYPMPMYSEVQKPKRPAPPPTAMEPDNIVCGSLHIKPGAEQRNQNVVEIRNKTNSMPHHYQRRSGEDLPNKYEEYVAEKREQHQQAPAPVFPAASERKASAPAIAPIYFPRKKPANLEEAINELEAIYKSLGLTEPPEPKPEPKVEAKPRAPTPSDFEKFALAHADEYDDEDSPTGEPDPVRDDVAYRNLQLSNLQHRASEKQPPFGIPVGPIVPAPQSDYLHVEPVRAPKKKSGSPDIVKDDLAVRALRKDPPGPKSSFVYPMQKKQRATRTQSANIYNLIQRDAAKPSGGDLSSYMELTRSIERAGSLSNLGGATETSDTSDVPATLDLLRKLKAQDEEQSKNKPNIPFRHPSQGGAIAQLPERLGQHEETPNRLAPVPAPRKSLTPEPLLEDALNKIALDAQASSIKLTQELQELRKEALITAARPKMNAEQQKLEQELQQIEAVSEAAKRCGQLLLDTLPDNDELDASQTEQPQPRKLHKEGKLIKAIDEVSEAANAVCDKILKDIVTTEPPVVVHEAVKVKQVIHNNNGEQLVMPHLIKKLDPIQSDKIEAIAKRCMRQLSELADAQPDYDNLAACNMSTAGGAAAVGEAAAADATLICPIAETKKSAQTRAQAKSQALEDIDKIMQECERQARSGSNSILTTITSSSSTRSTNNNNTNSNTTNSSTDDQRTTAPSMSSGSVSGNATTVSTTASSFSSSSDCLAKSSSPSTASRPMSSSITSFNPYSSSDYIKSQSSDYHAPSTDPIKTFSTTSYDVQSTPNNSSTMSTNNNITTQSTLSTNNNSNSNSNDGTSEHQTAGSSLGYSLPISPTSSAASSPALQLTPVGERRARSSSPSQYNSSEELAAIFGIEEQPKSKQQQQLRRKQSGKGATAIATANAPAAPLSNVQVATSCSCSSTNHNIRCAIANATTNPVLNVEPELELEPEPEPEIDVTTTTTTATTTSSSTSTSTSVMPTNESARSSSNCSSHSYKLATIPETELEAEADLESEQCSLKLSPNFNRIYASKVNIVMDRSETPEAATSQQAEANVAGAMTQFDSLSSLEETSSNPDSGNASLADYPLAGHSNASIELQTTYNSRFEVKEHYVSEVSISASDDETDTECVGVREQDFPPLPTEEELLESLREEVAVDESESETKLDEQQLLDETDKHNESIEIDNETVQRLFEEIAQQSLAEVESEELEAMKLDETYALSEAVYDLATEQLLTEADEHKDETELDEPELDAAELDEDELDYSALVELALDEAFDEDELETERDECDAPAVRRKSIVYETPQINLSISELKLNYETKVEQETTLDEEEANETKASNSKGKEENADDMPISDASARNERDNRLSKGLPLELSNSNNDDDDVDDEQPTTSTKALSVFGEVRTLRTSAPVVARAGGGGGGSGVMRGGLTTLEHVLVACTVGLITPNDLLTLCLIVIGVIIIVAIALT
ncbi:uncharacterized protein LOC133840938 isoform X8 [Drosophila sulfurigaster albostrigata]|uniref:uncharacterized protein LOC133840938 isoform X8 n=1 Tax=Drosophila sulfurigaster albostrigata TaxID=89887 RepID=UPI002D21ADBA|nr:uncharacterized protein LOC133840938 isoform X8 [Drosophila sulfurigaster albostrigata]